MTANKTRYTKITELTIVILIMVLFTAISSCFLFPSSDGLFHIYWNENAAIVSVDGAEYINGDFVHSKLEDGETLYVEVVPNTEEGYKYWYIHCFETDYVLWTYDTKYFENPAEIGNFNYAYDVCEVITSRGYTLNWATQDRTISHDETCIYFRVYEDNNPQAREHDIHGHYLYTFASDNLKRIESIESLSEYDGFDVSDVLFSLSTINIDYGTGKVELLEPDAEEGTGRIVYEFPSEIHPYVYKMRTDSYALIVLPEISNIIQSIIYIDLVTDETRVFDEIMPDLERTYHLQVHGDTMAYWAFYYHSEGDYEEMLDTIDMNTGELRQFESLEFRYTGSLFPRRHPCRLSTRQLGLC